MARVRIVHWREKESAALVSACKAAGFETEYDAVDFSALSKMIRAHPPDVLVFDLGALPSHSRESAAYLRRTKYAGHIPIVFVDGLPEKVEAVRNLLPDAIYTSLAGIRKALKAAGARKTSTPVIPPSFEERYAHRTVAQKLGVRERSTLALIDPPRDYAAAIGELPANVVVIEEVAANADVTLWFVPDLRAYESAMPRMRRLAGTTKFWVVWRKGLKDGLTDRTVRQIANDAGLVDYKICAVGPKWSGMAFARRKS